jgi:hypothetical protein
MNNNMFESKDELIFPRSQMASAFHIAARKVELRPKAESGSEMYLRMKSEQELKKNKAVKRAAKKMVKQKIW